MGNYGRSKLCKDCRGIIMKYIYTKTGAIVDSPCELKGRYWEVVKAVKKETKSTKSSKK